jgi:hypothetical protein
MVIGGSGRRVLGNCPGEVARRVASIEVLQGFAGNRRVLPGEFGKTQGRWRIEVVVTTWGFAEKRRDSHRELIETHTHAGNAGIFEVCT